MEIAKQYNPKDIEKRIYSDWETAESFRALPDNKTPYCIMIPLPNVTGALHLGHAINETLQDTMTRYHRMLGDNALWQPGTDHAGIATQAVVEKRLFEEEGKTRHDLGREGLVERIWDWKETYGNRIIEQLKSMGCSCDWERTRFTLDEVCTRAVRHTFFKMFKDGLIYRGKRMVNWDAMLQTSVSDDEVIHETVQGNLWYYWYPVKDSDEKVLIATTRPETMLGDTAVAVHPEDERYKHLIGKTAILPLTNREIPIIGDSELVDREFGTGCVKVTPAHDPNDYECGIRNNLEMLNILNPDGTINENGGQFNGMDRYEARKAVVKALEEQGLMEKIEPHENQVGHSDRSKTPIEPYLSDQWFVKMADLAQQAMDVVTNGKIKFHPERYAKMYIDWLSEKRDWPISRQLWWGHRIPIWYAKGCSEEDLKKSFDGREDVAWRWDDEYSQWLICAETEELSKDAVPGFTIEQDPDVLDTWFSSALWPYSTLGWPDETPDLKFWYPTSVLITNRDIVTLWVARMVMTGLYNIGDIPFHDVCVHVTICDGQGKRMSKSKGNGVDPLDIIEQYGADALRFVMAHMATETQDVRMPVQYKCPHCGQLTPQTAENMGSKTLDCLKCNKMMATRWADENVQKENGLALLTSDKFEIGRNFANKVWNASRFAVMNLEEGIPILTPEELLNCKLQIENLTSDEKWILERLAETVEKLSSDLDNFHFHDYANGLYDFIWSDFCDWYLESAKSDLHGENEENKKRAKIVLASVLSEIVKLLHPVMPYMSEEIWQLLHKVAGKEPGTMLIKASWPKAQKGFCPPELLEQVKSKFELIRLGRSLRSDLNIQPSVKVKFAIKPNSEETENFLSKNIDTLKKFLNSDEIDIDKNFSSKTPLPSHVGTEATIFLFPDSALDKEAELKRIGKQIEKVESYISSLEKKLSNEKFVGNAPAEIVEKEREKLSNAKEKLAKLTESKKVFKM